MKEMQMKRWIKILLTCIVFIGITVAMYLIGFKGDWVKPIVERAGFWGYIVFVLIQVVITTVMCFVPATTFTFTLMAVQIFGVLPGFICASIACFISSMVMFTIGDKLGEPFIDWLIGKDARIKAQKAVSTRATVLVPVMLAFPFFPDDAICMVSGMTKMKYWYFAIVALLCRTIGIGVTAFLGGNVLDYASFSMLDWIVFINLILIDVVLVWKLSTFVENAVNKYKAKKEEKGKGNDDNEMSTL